MAQQIDRAGNFQAEILEYGLREFDSGSMAVTLKCKVTAEWDQENQQWVDWSEYDVEAEGSVIIVKKDGSLNRKQVESLVKFAEWDASFASIIDQTWEPKPVAIVVNADTYKDETRYKISFINDHDRKPGANSNVDRSKLGTLNAKYGGQLRAVAATAKMNGTEPPKGRPQTPGRNAMGHTTDEANKAMAEASASKAGDDGIPF